MPRVSIIVPAFNAEGFLGATLDSVVAQTQTDHEVVVIDDGSSDRTAEIASRYSPRVRVLRQPNQGMSASRNRGISESDSEFVALLDADDLWHPRKLELQFQKMDARPEVGLSYTEFFIWDGSAPPVFQGQVSLAEDAGLSGSIYHQMILTNFVLPSSVLLRRRSIANLGLFRCDNQKTDDWEYFVRASREFPFAKLKDPLVAYRQSPHSLSRKISPVNDTELMREELIGRFGLISPQGQTVDAAELARRRYKDRRDFADAHVARGQIALGLRRFAHLVVGGPRRMDTLLTLAKAAARRCRSGPLSRRTGAN